MSAEIKPGNVYQEKAEGIKFPKKVKVRKIQTMGKLEYVQFMADNAAAQSAHPNGGFIPLASFLKVWEPAG
ncbi:MAG TPA: hypothetical protein VIU33_07150 [Nitrospiria bacterium]